MHSNFTTSVSQPRSALVLGASGSIGAAVAEALTARGWKVRGMVRSPEAARSAWQGPADSVHWVRGDSMVAGDVRAAAEGVQVIVHAVSPPGYRDWDKLVLPMIDNTIAAASSAGARILLPGTIYNYEPATTPIIRESSPPRPSSRKGSIRVELERRLQAASHRSPALVVRAGDFYGPRLRSSWFAQAMITPGRSVTRVRNLAPGIGHSWAYLPDLANTMVALLERPGLRPFESVGFEGFWDTTGHEFAALVAAALGRSQALPETAFPWWALRLAAPFGGFPREAMDILPYWRHPVRIDNARLVELLGTEPRTDPVLAMRATLRGLGCLPSTVDNSSIRTERPSMRS